MNESSLEDRYRRMLRLYPAEHRHDHEDEMIGVLLAKARPGQSRPDPRDLYDLARGALLIRLRRATGALSEDRWRDAFAIVGVIAPILLAGLSLRLLAQGIDGIFVIDDEWHHPPLGLTFPYRHLVTLNIEGDVRSLAWCAVAVLALLGLRRTGIAAAVAVVVANIGVAFFSTATGIFGWQSTSSDLPVVLGLLTAGALWASPAPRRGLELMGQWSLTLILMLTAGIAMATIRLGSFHDLHAQMSPLKPMILILTVVGVVSLMRSAAGRRACALLAMPLICLAYAYEPVGVSGMPVRILVYVIVVPMAGFALATGGISLLERARPGAR